MTPTLEKAWGYQGDAMNLPVRDIATALPFYETVLGFRVLSRSHTPHKSAVLARDDVQIALAENGGDSSQDGCAFHVSELELLFAEFKANGLQKELSQFDIEHHDVCGPRATARPSRWDSPQHAGKSRGETVFGSFDDRSAFNPARSRTNRGSPFGGLCHPWPGTGGLHNG